ncbi:MAG: DUF4783 domain-containing protein [Chitinophagales bacterium]|nr:DUF4783 domain-containing protein [Chitinophagales bacterium]
MKLNRFKTGIMMLAIVPFFAFTLFAQDFGQINLAIKMGNAKELARQLDEVVEITILDKEASYSKAQAEMVLKDFFDSHKPESFEIIHKGSSNEGSKYGIGKLITDNGNFRTYVLAKQKGSVFLIQKISFEED